MYKTIGFIGCGNMGKAIAEGILKAGAVPGENMYVSDHHPDRLKTLEETYHVLLCDQATTVKNSEILVLGVKPHMYHDLIEEIRDQVKEDVIIVDIAAGQTIENVQHMFGREIKVVRIMPNTPAAVMEGMTALCGSTNLSSDEITMMKELFSSFGRCEILSETIVSAAGTASGASPAFIYMLIEAMADGAVLLGMKREQAYTFCAQAVLGSARMVLESGMHPGALKDQVCSPGGSTIEGVAVLENSGFRSAIIEAMRAANQKSELMKKSNEEH